MYRALKLAGEILSVAAGLAALTAPMHWMSSSGSNNQQAAAPPPQPALAAPDNPDAQVQPDEPLNEPAQEPEQMR